MKEKRMGPKQILTLPKPRTGVTVYWWRVDLVAAWGYDINHCRSTYHLNTPWSDHPWSKEHKWGSDFTDSWAIEQLKVRDWDETVGWMYKRTSEWRSMGRWDAGTLWYKTSEPGPVAQPQSFYVYAEKLLKDAASGAIYLSLEDALAGLTKNLEEQMEHHLGKIELLRHSVQEIRLELKGT